MECLHEDAADGVRIIRLVGRMDTEGNDQVALRLTTLTVTGGAGIVVDLSGLDFIGSLGIGSLVSAAKAVKLRKAVLALCGATGDILKALERTNVPAFIPTCASIDEARTRVTAPAQA